jgi:hypothetical protein
MSNNAKIELTKEQRVQIQKEMGLVCDNLILSLAPEDEELKISDLGDNLLIAMSDTNTVS